MTRIVRTARSLLMALVAGAAVLLAAAPSLADKLHLKDGTVLDGTVVKEENGIIYFEHLVNGKKVTDYYDMADVSKVVRENSTPAPEVKPEPKPEAKPEPKKEEPKQPAPAMEPKKDDAAKSDQPKKDGDKSDPANGSGDKKDGKSPRKLTGRPQRVAVLNFGAPLSWQGEIGDTVGEVIVANTWKEVIPLLEKDEVDIVVVRIHSGGGYTFEMMPFNFLFQNEYKKKFRTVAWIESAISCAAMSPWPIDEMYFLPEGNIGGCTEWHGRLQLSDPMSQEMRLAEMERASKWANRSEKIMRAMQIREPLSCNVNEDGTVDWFQDLSGKIIVNRPGEILTLNAKIAMETKFGRGIAATLDELMKVMGIAEYEVAGQAATKMIDQNMRDCHHTAKHLEEVDAKYGRALAAARSLTGPANKMLRDQELGVASQALKQMYQWMSVNPNFFRTFGRPPEWFKQQEEIIKELRRQ